LGALYEARQRLNELLSLKNLKKKTAKTQLPNYRRRSNSFDAASYAPTW